jgi:hypothetical protein
MTEEGKTPEKPKKKNYPLTPEQKARRREYDTQWKKNNPARREKNRVRDREAKRRQKERDPNVPNSRWRNWYAKRKLKLEDMSEDEKQEHHLIMAQRTSRRIATKRMIELDKSLE